MNKRLLIIVCLFFSVFLLIGCSDEKERDNKKDETISSERETVNESQIKEQILYDKNKISIVAKEIIYEGDETKISIEIKNDGDKDIRVEITDVLVNNLVIDTLFESVVEVGENSTEYLIFMNSDFEFSMIEVIQTINFSLSIIDDNTYNDLDMLDEVEIKTDATGYKQEYGLDNSQLIELKKVRLYMQSTDDNNGLIMFVENNTKYSMIISTDNILINEYEIDKDVYKTIPAGAKCYFKIYLNQEDLEKYKIKEVNEIMFDISVYDWENMSDYIDSYRIEWSF